MERRDSSNRTTASTTDGGDVQPLLGAQYEVFLNFRGPDTRLNFTDCLYHSMDLAGIRVFRDNEEIRKGETIIGELERAIKSSTIFIPIFSRNYASSAWCLRELKYMVDCLRNRDGKAMIMPLFFDVDPADVKLKTGLYHDALQKHEEKYGYDEVQQWKEALEKVARIKGWDLKNKGQGELIKLIVAEVLIKLHERERDLPNHLVGIHDRVEEVVRLLDNGSPDVRYLVIHGMGGIGKTTLAKVVFNQISSWFDGCSFLSNVREASEGGKVVQLQKLLLSEILNFRALEISDCDAGIYHIKRRFRDKKVLIVLDDLDKWDQLLKLAENSDWFGPGSRIIITTRDTNFLPIEEENRENGVQMHFEEFQIYQMRELSHRHAFQLFSKRAFRMDSPPSDYYHISRDIICKTGGLPLALEIIGSSLCGKSKPLWRDTLKKLDLVPIQDVHRKLMISFDMLEDAQKEIFLDIACHFIDEEKIYPHYMWKALDFSPKIEIFVLSRMSLIKVNGDKLSMHDLLIDLGRKIVRQESKVLEKRSRLWSPKDALNVVQNRKANRDLKALHLLRCHLSITPDFSTCLNLRILVFAKHCPESPLIDSSISKLQRLKHLEIIAATDQPSKLSGSPHFDLCALPSAICCLKYLSSLKLEGQGIQELHPSIGEMAGLTCLSLVDCYRLRKLPDSIGKLRLLLELNLFNTRIKELPDSIADLKRLEKMNLGHTCIRELPIFIGGLESLLDLDLQSTKITTLPASIGYLKRLQRLFMIYSKIRELPDSIADLKRLEVMNLSDTQIRELPHSIGELESLIRLNLRHTKITALPASIGYVKRLKDLNTYGCKIREPLKAIEMLENLEMMEYHDWRNIHITWPPKLWLLYIHCDNPQSLPRLPSGLRLLGFDGVKSPIEQPLLSELRCLLGLRLCRWGLREIEFKQLENLRRLDVYKCESLVRLSGLSSLGKLEKLEIYLCSQLIEIGDLGEIESLEQLIIGRCSSINRLPDLSKLHKLRRLRVDRCKSLQDLPNLPSSLEHLSIAHWSSTEKLSDLSKLRKLKELSLRHCELLQGLPDVPDTCRLDVHGCPMLGEFGDNYGYCRECLRSNPSQSGRRRIMYR